MKLGSYEIDLVSDGEFRLDGGSMYGVVPRVLWEKVAPPDEKNRIRMGLTSLLVRGNGRVLLVDTGIGTRLTEKDERMFAMSRPNGGLEDALRARGVGREEVTDVVLTHLHFDHAGGCVVPDGDRLVPAFPNATYHVQRDQWEWAANPTPKDRASFHPDDFSQLGELAKLNLVEGRRELLDGIEVVPTNGHTVGHQCVRIEGGGETLFYLADLAPTAGHLRLAYVMGFDLFPLTTIQERAEWLGAAADGEWIAIFEHDPELPAARLRREGDNFAVAEPVTI